MFYVCSTSLKTSDKYGENTITFIQEESNINMMMKKFKPFNKMFAYKDTKKKQKHKTKINQKFKTLIYAMQSTLLGRTLETECKLSKTGDLVMNHLN